MAIAYRAGTQATSGANSVTTLSPAKPTGVVAGDLLIATLVVPGAAQVVTPPSGWSLLDAALDSDSTPNVLMNTYYRFAAANEPASWTWSWSVAQGGIVIVNAFSGAEIAEHAFATVGTTSGTARSTPALVTAGDRWLFSAFVETQGGDWSANTDVTRFAIKRNGAVSVLVQDTGSVVPSGTYTKSATTSANYKQGVQQIVALRASASAGSVSYSRRFVIDARTSTGVVSIAQVAGPELAPVESPTGVFTVDIPADISQEVAYELTAAGSPVAVKRVVLPTGPGSTTTVVTRYGDRLTFNGTSWVAA